MTVQVTPRPAAPDGPLPFTGADLSLLLVVAVVLLGIGIVLTKFRRHVKGGS